MNASMKYLNKWYTNEVADLTSRFKFKIMKGGDLLVQKQKFTCYRIFQWKGGTKFTNKSISPSFFFNRCVRILSILKAGRRSMGCRGIQKLIIQLDLEREGIMWSESYSTTAQGIMLDKDWPAPVVESGGTGRHRDWDNKRQWSDYSWYGR